MEFTYEFNPLEDKVEDLDGGEGVPEASTTVKKEVPSFLSLDTERNIFLIENTNYDILDKNYTVTVSKYFEK